MKKKVSQKEVKTTLEFLDSFKDDKPKTKKRTKRPRIIGEQLRIKMYPKD